MKFNLTDLLPARLRPYAKYVYALLGFGVFLATQGLIDGEVAHWVTAIAGLLAVPGLTYHAENRTGVNIDDPELAVPDDGYEPEHAA